MPAPSSDASDWRQGLKTRYASILRLGGPQLARDYIQGEIDVTVADPRIQPAVKEDYLSALRAIQQQLLR